MFKLSDNYYQRKCYLKQEQVPTQSVMKQKMTSPLARVYFRSMKPKIKVLAGLEPPMKGGGSDWYVPPDDLLEGKSVMRPIKKEYLSKFGFAGIDSLGERSLVRYLKQNDLETKQALLDSDATWKRTIEETCRQHSEDLSKEAAKENTRKILTAFKEFSIIYSTSLNNIEALLSDAAAVQVNKVREETYLKMSKRFKTYLKYQATMLYDKYAEKLHSEKLRLKAQFVGSLEEARHEMFEKLHDINVEKHTVVEKLRHYLECQNLACRIYVALKEREECDKEMQLAKDKHRKYVKALNEEIQMKDFEISLAKEKAKVRDEFVKAWQRKICEVIKKFQMFIKYCFNSLPEQADFFINMEKLLMLQLNEAVENPSAESIFVTEDKFHTPQPRPHPFFLCCDKGYKPDIDQKLCPKHCTSSSSQLPVIIVNKRCIYGACDNLQMYSEKMKTYAEPGDDINFIDDHDYTHDIPVKFTESKQIEELNQQSSLLRILQKEYPNLKGMDIECCVCRVPHCFCDRLEKPKMSSSADLQTTKETSSHSIESGLKIETRDIELAHEREPKWESYMKYMKPVSCKCPKTAKKNLEEHLPAYMRNLSVYDSLELPNYERCSLTTLKKLVRKAQRKRPKPKPEAVESKTRDAITQYSDQEFDLLCTCFSEDEIARVLGKPRPGGFQVVDGSISPSFLQESPKSFATKRAYSLRRFLADSPELEEIFKKSDCIL